MKKEEFIFCPLGGSGEIGMNMNLFAYGNPENRKWIIVDIGVTFADEAIPGLDLIYPDPGFIVDNVYCLPGVPSILKSMLGGLNNKIIGGKKILSETINLKTVESEISLSLEKVQNKFKNAEIGSYPFFKQGKIGVSIVIRSTEKNLIKKCRNEIKNFIKKKNIKIAERK